MSHGMQAARNTAVAAGGAVKKEPAEEVVVEVDSHEEEAEKAVKKRRRKKKKAACDPHTKRACVDCTKRCARIHGRAAASPSPSLPSSSSSKAQARPTPAAPSFFKVMMGYFSEDMDIPPPFGRTILDLAGSNIYLEDAFGLRWRVRICLRDGGVLSFGHGWKNFVLDHAVSCGEFLVFRQIARSVFTVQMFAPSAVERLCLCEKNNRQSRKRKPTQKTSSPAGIRTVKTTKNSVGNCKKKRRTDHPNGITPRGCKMPVQVCVDDSDVPDSASELKCSETSQRVAEVGAAQEIPEAEDPSAGHECKAREVLDVQAEPADECAIFEEKESERNAIARVIENRISEATAEIENLPANVDATAPLSVMDLDEVSIDDIYLSADIYEFESDIYDTEAISAGLSMEGPVTTVQDPGFNCLEDAPQNQKFPMGVGHGFVTPETLPSCTENKQVTDAPGTGTEYVCVSVHDIKDINALPSNEPSLFGEENSPPPADAEVHSNGCRFSTCNNDEGNNLSPVMNKQPAQKECSSMTIKQAKSHGFHGNTHDNTGHHAAEILPRSAEPHEFPDLTQNPLQIVQLAGNGSEGIHSSGTSESCSILALAANSTKFCISVPAPGQTWLELPSRLPVLPRTKKQGRKVVILRDPSMRLWPVLYHCTPRFSGFITGWVDICSENNLREGDTCEFELSGNSELSFQVLVPTTQ